MAHLHALEVVYEHMPKITLEVDAACWQVLDLGSCGISKVEGMVLSDEELIVDSPCKARHVIILQ